jgi:predicted nucleic acid-binding protein
VTVVLDTGVVVALLSAADPRHAQASAWLTGLDEDLVTSPLALAEMDHFAAKRGSAEGAEALVANLESGAFGVRWWADALRETIDIVRRHPFAGLTDASLVALAGILRTNRIATFDQHFRSITPVRGAHFVLLPQDA